MWVGCDDSGPTDETPTDAANDTTVADSGMMDASDTTDDGGALDAASPADANSPADAADALDGSLDGASDEFALLDMSPADFAVHVPRDVPITITFSRNIDVDTVTAQSEYGACTGSVQVSADDLTTCIAMNVDVTANVVTLQPSESLALGETYQVRLSSEFRAQPANRSLATPRSWVFA